MPDPRDFLPQPPWEGPPIPRALGKYIPPEEKYRLVKRTKRGSLVVIQREGGKATLEVANIEDMMDISRFLRVSGIKWDIQSGISKSAWEGVPVYLRMPRGMGKGYPGYTITFDFSELERIVSPLEKEILLLE